MHGYRRQEIVSDVVRFLAGSIDLALAAGIAWERIIIDPGIGFGTTLAENLARLRRLGELRELGRGDIAQVDHRACAWRPASL